ncbi:hypothetical protein Hanom_Chr09g00782011 [Helianthus anomalus]
MSSRPPQSISGRCVELTTHPPWQCEGCTTTTPPLWRLRFAKNDDWSAKISPQKLTHEASVRFSDNRQKEIAAAWRRSVTRVRRVLCPVSMSTRLHSRSVSGSDSFFLNPTFFCFPVTMINGDEDDD